VYRTTIGFHNSLYQDKKVFAYVIIGTDLGHRAYAKKELTSIFSIGDVAYADGTYLADGSITAGSASAGVIDKAGKILSLSSFNRTINPKKEGLLLGFTKKQQQHITVVLANNDKYFSKMLPKEPFLAKELRYYIGFPDLNFYEHLRVFTGIISEVSITSNTMILEADEK